MIKTTGYWLKIDNHNQLWMLFVLLLSVTFPACFSDTEYIYTEKKAEKLKEGDACLLPSDCDNGRCIGGVCVDTECTESWHCLEDELCVFNECVPSDQFACEEGQSPLMSVTPIDLDFGDVRSEDNSVTVTIENSGNCLLNIQGVTLSSTGDEGFSCDACDVSRYPTKLAPKRSVDVVIKYTAINTGAVTSELLIRSDDLSVGEEGLLRLPIKADYSGVPVLVVEPLDLHFGHVIQGDQRTEVVILKNMSPGSALAKIKGIYAYPPIEFSLPDSFAEITPNNSLLLKRFDPNDENTEVRIPVTYSPSGFHDSVATLYIDLANQLDPLLIPLTGSSLGPPQININQTSMLFVDELTEEAYSVGHVAFRQFTITNSGQSELVVNMDLQDPSGDFSLSPSYLPPIAAGGAVVVSVFYNPSAPTDAVHPHAPETAANAFVNVTSNDNDPASDVLKVISIRGFAKGGTFDDVLKIEMEFENGESGWAGNDYRNVDLEIISPLGFSCAKPTAQYVADGAGGVIATSTEDLCDEWNDSAVQGRVNWVSLGQNEEPERIMLYNLGQDTANGEVFTIRLHYVEDCANIPTGGLADLLGIGASVLLGVLGSSVGVPIAVSPDSISDLIQENCWDHASSLATTHIVINGEEVAAPNYRLRRKGDYVDIAKVRRQNGQFTLEQ